jgi:hypothetical protein
MMGMSIWVSGVLLPIGVSVATTLVTGLTVGPRLAARGKRIQAAHDSRDRFGDAVLDILALCGNLEATDIRPDAAEPLSPKVQAERDRWLSQIDETTGWLVDHWQQFALTYRGANGIRNLVAEYVMTARGVWLSDRPLDVRIRLLMGLTEPVQTIYFASRWRVVKDLRDEMARLRAMLDSADGDAAGAGSLPGCSMTAGQSGWRQTAPSSELAGSARGVSTLSACSAPTTGRPSRSSSPTWTSAEA